MPVTSKSMRIKSRIQHSSTTKTKQNQKKKASIQGVTTIKVRPKIHSFPLREAKTAQDKRKKDSIRNLERRIREIQHMISTSTIGKKAQSLTKKLHSLQENLTKQRNNFMSGKTIQSIVKKIEKYKLSTPVQLVNEIPLELKDIHTSIKQWESEVTKHLKRSLTLAHRIDQMKKNGEERHKIQKIADKVTSHFEKAIESRTKAIHTAQNKSLLQGSSKQLRKRINATQ